VAIGMPLPQPGTPRPGAPARYTNSVALIRAGAESASIAARYDKRHLVPFGEFVPRGFGWFVAMMDIPLGEFARGAPGQAPFAVAGQRFAFNICYEDLFGEELIEAIRGPQGATVLVNVSNIAWFGDSQALPQHLAIARMRTLETGRPMLRATNTGVTAAIDHRGRVTARLPSYTEAVLDVTVRGTTGLTAYVRLGNAAPLAGCVALLGLAWLAGAGRPGTKKLK
jgi:apolipoprotein N-acyltransferase